MTFAGKAINGTSAYELSFIVDSLTYGQEIATLNYSRAGSQMVSVTETKTVATGATSLSIKGSGNVNAVVTSVPNGGSVSGDVKSGTTKVGTIANKTLTFTDGTYILLSI